MTYAKPSNSSKSSNPENSSRPIAPIKPFRLTALLLAAGLLAGALTGCGSSSKSEQAAAATAGGQDAVKIKIADIVSNPVFRVALHEGFFKQYGIDADIVTFATPAEGINSLFIKQTDIAYGADFPILNAVSKGDYAIVAATGANNDISAKEWRLYVGKDIQKPEDLKGKKLSTMRGTFIPYLWDQYLGEHGVDPKDTTVIGQGGVDESYIALKKGEIDAAWVFGAANNAKFAELDGVHVLTDMAQTKVRIGGAIIAPNTLIAEHPQAVANFIAALEQSSQFIAAHPDDVADILYKEVKQPKDATLKDLPANAWAIGFTQEAFDSLASQKKWMVENGVIQDDFDLSAKLSLDAVKQAVPDRVTYAH